MNQILRVAITGPDGSGKSTVCAALGARLSARSKKTSVQEVSVWNAMSDSRIALLPSREVTEKYLSTLGNTSRPLFIFHALARACEHAEKRALENPLSSQILLLNGYWYKYSVSELGYGVPEKTVLGAIEGFSAPDLVFCLDVDPETAWHRKMKATAYEQGGAEHSETSFLSFQNRLKKIWESVERMSLEREQKKWIHLSSRQTVEEIVSAVLSEIEARLEKA